ncbi:unnamed protein product [Rotaria magnacalcarata]|uniref:THAP9-like helix-turn-helix domain-containing protein n=2 Tax=Rotaria magnacalcarata TaxID=392030 RepID=A0A815W756_9BILA|nr:unnamed protein product [Rotaria magnacalcarata]CAF1537196.1 unnamed protein product [Rotaria magnacalcarata]CAF3805862.1 unnamed protein product [Rotaria magnacalcarata]CAF3812936.1 unnamed protein product [Rotaria magnacalcarata]CAF3822559.1 unnamed protein product [Rotaria magnacalcarata]
MTDCAENFLNTTDIFEIFKYDSEELDEIKHQSCYKLKNGDYIVRTGVKNNMNYLKEIFVKKLEEHRISSSSFQQDISKELMNKNPLLRSLITWYSHNANVLKNINVNNSHNNNNNDNSSSNNNSSINNLFISSFIDTIANNIVKSKQGQCYDDSMKKFAILLYTFGGKLAYQLVRINIIGALPSLSTLSRLMSNTDTIITEGRFRIMALKQYTDSLNAKFGFCSEDCTGVIKKIKYDVTTNSFVGFVTKFSNGIPIPEYYKTDSYEQLKAWFTNIKKSNLLNIFMFQPLPPPGHSNTPSPFLMNAFGADGTGSAMEILYRWVHVFEYSLENQIRIIGFSTDGDNKYMRATRLMAGFFASLSKFLPYEHPDVFQIKLKYGWPWFYLRKQQLFLFFQDPTHLVTKWRNRLLSRTADLHIGDEIISMDHIRSIVKNSKYTKLDHGLTRSDLNPKDRQNYRSCVKLTSEDLSRILIEDENCLGTHVYLQVLKMIIKAYIEKSTTIVKRKHKQDDNNVIDQKLDEVYDLNIEKMIANSYEMALVLVKLLNIISILKKHNILDMNILSQYIYDNLKENSRLVDDTTLPPSSFDNVHDSGWETDDSDDDDYVDNDDDDDDDDDDDNDYTDVDGNIRSQLLDELIDIDDEEQNIASVRTNFQGINIRDNIDPDDLKSFFKIKINNKIKYLHKQSACWLLTDENTHISSDRLSRVMQTSENKI